MYKKLENYLIYPNGQIKNLKSVIHSLHCSGYYVVNDFGERKTFKLHRLLAMLFVPNPNDFSCVNHKDENKLNNSLDNLEWCDITYNNTYGTRIERSKEKQGILGRTGLHQIKDGKTIAIYNSVKEASESTGIKASNIHGRQKSSGGWELKN